jgi:hypothetical protein
MFTSCDYFQRHTSKYPTGKITEKLAERSLVVPGCTELSLIRQSCLFCTTNLRFSVKQRVEISRVCSYQKYRYVSFEMDFDDVRRDDIGKSISNLVYRSAQHQIMDLES